MSLTSDTTLSTVSLVNSVRAVTKRGPRTEQNAAVDVSGSPCELRPATTADIDPIATIWHSGWREVHLGKVPAELEAHRTLPALRAMVEDLLPGSVIGLIKGEIAGFVTVADDQIAHVYVCGDARGTGLAALLMDRGESLIHERYPAAWLAVVAENTRARRFYERAGWRDCGPFLDPLTTTAGVIYVPTHRYEKP